MPTKVFTQTIFNRGASMSGGEGSFRYTVGCNTRWVDGYLRAGPKATAETISPTGTIKYMLQCSNGYYYGFSSDGKIYERGVDGVWTLAYTDADGEIFGAAEWEGYLYWAKATTIRRFAVASIFIGVPWGAGPGANWQTGLQQNAAGTTYHTMVPALGYLCVANGRYLGVIDTSAAWNATALTLPPSYLISSIVELGDTVALGIYVNPSTLVVGEGWVYQWDGKSPTWNRRIRIPAQGVNAMCLNDVFLIQAGQQGQLFTTDLNSVTPLGTFFNRSEVAGGYLRPYQMAPFHRLIAMLGPNGSLGNQVYTYGRLGIGKPYALEGEALLVASPDQSLTLGTLIAMNDYTMLASYNTSVENIAWPGNMNSGTASAYSEAFLGYPEDHDKRKLFRWIKVSFFPLAGGSLSLYYGFQPGAQPNVAAKLADGTTSFAQTNGREAVFLVGAEGHELHYYLNMTNFGQQAVESISIAYDPLP